MGIMIAYVASAAAPPFPKFYLNGVRLGTAHEPFLLYGTITQENATLGNITCQMMMAGKVWNETTEGTEKGLMSLPEFSTGQCRAANPCKVKNTKGEEVEGIYLTAEAPPITEGTEAHLTGVSSLPWTGELLERGAGKRQPLIHHVKYWVVSPPPAVGKGGGCLGTEMAFEGAKGGELAPILMNGTKNGLHPAQMELSGAETGHTISSAGPAYFTAKPLILAGAKGNFELITAE
jgi:hypothetical protein